MRILTPANNYHQSLVLPGVRRPHGRTTTTTTTTTTIVMTTTTTRRSLRTDVSHGGWCQKTCATKYVSRHSRFVWANCQGAPLSPPSRTIPSSPCPPISSHSGLLVRFFSFLLLFTPLPPHPCPTRSLPYSLLAGSILASSSRLEWDPSRCKRNGADAPGIFQPWVVPLKFCIAWEWLVGNDRKRSDVTRVFPPSPLSWSRNCLLADCTFFRNAKVQWTRVMKVQLSVI